MSFKTAYQGHEHGHACRGRNKILHPKSYHLGEVAHRRFSPIPLPVGIGDKADSRIERRIRRDGREFLRVQGEPALQALKEIEEEQSCRAEDKNSAGVLFPAHLFLGVDATDPVEKAFHWPEQPVQAERSALVNSGHVKSQRFCEEQQNAQIENDLQYIVAGHESASGLRSATTR